MLYEAFLCRKFLADYNVLFTLCRPTSEQHYCLSLLLKTAVVLTESAATLMICYSRQTKIYVISFKINFAYTHEYGLS